MTRKQPPAGYEPPGRDETVEIHRYLATTTRRIPVAVAGIGSLAPMKERLTLEPIAHDAEVGRWLAALEDGRRDTLRELENVTPQMVDWYPEAPLNSIGSLLYHIALIEADWVATEILELTDYPPELATFFPWPDREPGGHLSRVDGQSLDEHRARLDRVRQVVLGWLRPIANEDFHRVRNLEQYDVAPDWVIHHLLQHEAEHRAHIAWLRDTYS